MNQWIEIEYIPGYWEIFFFLSGKYHREKYHREKAPSFFYSYGAWCWYKNHVLQKCGYNFDWNSTKNTLINS